MKLSSLKEVELREIWEHEALNFSKWLSEEANLDLLSKTLNLNLNSPQTEVRVGDFSVDILCKDDKDENVIIENQLERTDHDHLGKVITYASGLKARTIVWIVRAGRDEHVEAINWLNEITDAKHNFFLVEIKVYKIADSPPAPKFEIVEQPNNWAKSVKSESNKVELTQFHLDRQKFWEEFIDYASKQDFKDMQNIVVPRINYWPRVCAIGETQVALNAAKRTMYIHLWTSLEVFNELKAKQEEIEKQFKFGMRWKEWKTGASIRIEIPADITDQANREELIKSLYLNTKQFIQVFQTYL